jgi:Domain of unknown function (DUF6398)
MAKTKPEPGEEPTNPTAARQAHDRIVGLTDSFCREHLNAEYEALCRKLAGVLARKRPSPMVSGKPETWAAVIVRVIGCVNFLHDSSQKPHLKLTAIDQAFGISSATGQAKSKAIRDLLKIRSLDPQWTLPSRMDTNPLAWMIEINGFIVDARYLKREFQEEALRKGLIPYIPEKKDR